MGLIKISKYSEVPPLRPTYEHTEHGLIASRFYKRVSDTLQMGANQGSK